MPLPADPFSSRGLGRQSRPPRQAPHGGSARARVSTRKSCLHLSRNSAHILRMWDGQNRGLYPWP